MTEVPDLAAWMARRLGEDAERVVWRAAPGEVRRLGLALDPQDVPPDPPVDAMWLHRVYQVGGRWAGRAVLNSHDGFDAHLTTGWNFALAEELGWQELDRVDLGRARLLLARPPEASWGELLGTFTRTFGGVERVLTPATRERPVVALANAMRPELLTEAYERGATTYVTGQFRPGARDRAEALGVGVVALGHRRSELWGVARLARELGEAFPDVTPLVFAGPVEAT